LTRVFGQLFKDERDGILAIQPSKPFFGCDRGERHYSVADGSIDIELLPTPRGVFYNVGFKAIGDTRRTDYTLRWTVPAKDEINVGIKPENQEAEQEAALPNVAYQVKLRRLASDLAKALERIKSQEEELALVKQQEDNIRRTFEQHKRDVEVVLTKRDQHIAQLQSAHEPKVQTVIQEVPVPPKALQDRIDTLEREQLRLIALNDRYYQAFLELHQLKLEGAQSNKFPDPVKEIPGTAQQRLIHKLLAK